MQIILNANSPKNLRTCITYQKIELHVIGQLRSEPRVGVVPANHDLRAPGLLEHVEHLRLEHRVDGLDRDAIPRLRHGEHIHDTYLGVTK